MIRPWLIYALGGGWGHVMRALSLARVVIPHQPVEILCNSPYVKLILSSSFWHQHLRPYPLQIHPLTPTATLAQAATWIAEAITSRPWQCLIVDTFPRGLVGELTPCFDLIPSLPKVWIHRDLSPTYVERYDLRSHVQHHYHQVLIPGELADPPLGDLGVRTPPWLLRNPQELPSRQQIRAQMGVTEENTPLIVICASGQEQERSLYGQLAAIISTQFSHLFVRCLSADLPPGCPLPLWIQHWPGIEILWGADLILGAAGYNTIMECLALGIPLIAFPWRRLYDRQRRRIQAAQALNSTPILTVQSIPAALLAIQTLLNQPRQIPRAHYRNGTLIAAQIIENRLQHL